MSFLSLKGVLQGYLEHLLFGVCEDNPLYFTNFLHKDPNNELFPSKVVLTEPISWRNIPLEKVPAQNDEQKSGQWAYQYSCALPHIIAHRCLELRESAPVEPVEIARALKNQLESSHTGCGNSDLDHNTGLIGFMKQLWCEFEIETSRPGWLSFCLSKNGIDLWIQHHQKNFQADRNHTQLFLNYGYLSQTSYSLSEGLKFVDRDHNCLTFKRLYPHSDSQLFKGALERSVLEGAHTTLLDTKNDSDSANRYHDRGGQNVVDGQSHEKAHQKQLIPAASKSMPVRTELSSLSSAQRASAESWLWQAQYTHARCCSLIARHTAAQQIATQQTAAQHLSEQPTVTRPATEYGSGAITHRLIAALIETTDDIFWIPYRWPSKQYFLLLKSASQLCQAFEAFYKHNLTGFGCAECAVAPMSQHHRDRPHVRHGVHQEEAATRAELNLVIATRNILKALLQSYLEAETPTEL